MGKTTQESSALYGHLAPAAGSLHARSQVLSCFSTEAAFTWQGQTQGHCPNYWNLEGRPRLHGWAGQFLTREVATFFVQFEMKDFSRGELL
jgi:hypothetical protein